MVATTSLRRRLSPARSIRSARGCWTTGTACDRSAEPVPHGPPGVPS